MKLLLFSRRGVVHAADELRRTFAAIARYGFDFVVNKEFAETIRSLGVAQIPAEKEYGCNACPPVGDGAVMVCYGGDGTLLDGVRLLGGAPVPVVGINAGHMGFLTGGRKEAIEELFAEIARGTLRIEQRTMLRVEGAVEGMPQGALAVNYDRLAAPDVQNASLGSNSVLMLLRLLRLCGAKAVLLAGADGYKPGTPAYADSLLHAHTGRGAAFNTAMAGAIKACGLDVTFITPSEYAK